jgi:sn-glycerol 3-phosphate transport system substrate-binding protein
MEPKLLENWVQSTFYVTPRRSVQPLLQDFYSKNPYRSAAFSQLENAVPRPTAPGYAIWRGFLEEAIVRVTKEGVAPRAALEDAQKKALAAR